MNIQDQFKELLSQKWANVMDREIIERIWGDIISEPFTHEKTFKNKKGETRHIIHVNTEIWDWLCSEHNQFGCKNPEWTVSNYKVNISDKLYSLLVLKFSK